MATIKIDRGFTQKIQQKGLVHSPNEAPHPPKKSGPGSAPKSRNKGRAWALAGGAGVLVLVALALVVLNGGGDAPKAPPPAAAPAPSAAAPQPAPQADFVDPDEELYAKHTGKPASQPAQTSETPRPAAAPNTPVMRDLPLGGSQGLLCEYFDAIPGKSIDALRTAAAFPSQPSRTVQVGRFELSENVGEHYGVRVRGYLIPPASGTYTLSLCADDAAEFWLSTDDTPAQLRKRMGTGSTLPKNSWTSRGEQQSAALELSAGQRYYLEAYLKENTGLDYLMVAWRGPVSDKYAIIEARYLSPWTDAVAAETPADSASGQKRGREARLAALAPARAAVEEQQRKLGTAYRFAEAAEALKSGKAAWANAEALALIEDAILRFELLGRLRAFVQAELAKAPAKGVWTAFGGKADVTTATDEGVTVAPGRIVAWAMVPPDQMLKLVNATLARAVADPNTKGLMFLGAAVFCKDVAGGVDLALKYRERAVANHSGLTTLAERVLGGTPESIQAEIRIKASRAELARLAETAAGLRTRVQKSQAAHASVIGLVPGALIDYWLTNPYGSLSDVRAKGLLKTPPAETRILSQLESPQNYAEKYVARLSGFLTPTETGDFYFYLAADDQGELWLSADETPERLALCVKTDTHSSYRAWDKEQRRSKPVSLAKGQHYYVEALLREGEKGDHISVAWSPVADDTPSVITASNLLYAATAGFTPQAQDLRQKIDLELQATQVTISDVTRLGEADESLDVTSASATSAMADEAQQQVSRAKAALLQAEQQMKHIDVLIAQLKEVTKPVPDKK